MSEESPLSQGRKLVWLGPQRHRQHRTADMNAVVVMTRTRRFRPPRPSTSTAAGEDAVAAPPASADAGEAATATHRPGRSAAVCSRRALQPVAAAAVAAAVDAAVAGDADVRKDVEGNAAVATAVVTTQPAPVPACAATAVARERRAAATAADAVPPPKPHEPRWRRAAMCGSRDSGSSSGLVAATALIAAGAAAALVPAPGIAHSLVALQCRKLLLPLQPLLVLAQAVVIMLLLLLLLLQLLKSEARSGLARERAGDVATAEATSRAPATPQVPPAEVWRGARPPRDATHAPRCGAKPRNDG